MMKRDYVTVSTDIGRTDIGVQVSNRQSVSVHRESGIQRQERTYDFSVALVLLLRAV